MMGLQTANLGILIRLFSEARSKNNGSNPGEEQENVMSNKLGLCCARISQWNGVRDMCLYFCNGITDVFVKVYNVSMQVCKYVNMQMCKYASMQVCKYKNMHVSKNESVQV